MRLSNCRWRFADGLWLGVRLFRVAAGNDGWAVGGFARSRFFVFWSLVIGHWSFAQTAAPPVQPPDPVEKAVKAGVGYLVRSQLPEGMIQEKDKAGSHGVAMTALALMGMASVGHQPADKSPEGEAMRKAVAFLVRPDALPASGYFGQRDGSRMYGHGIVTLALTELLGMGADKAQDAWLRDRAQRGVNLILAAQRVRKHDARFVGGWRYAPDAGDADLSVTVWQLLALRSAKNAGLVVPKEAIDAAVGYLRRSYVSGRDAQGRPTNLASAFGYVPGQPPQFAMAAAGLLAMQVCGLQDAPEARGAADWLRAARPVWETQWFFYGTYYYSQAMHRRGGEHGSEARARVESLLIPQQQPDGAWLGVDNSEATQGKVYGTALALLSLSVRHQFLPIYQD